MANFTCKKRYLMNMNDETVFATELYNLFQRLIKEGVLLRDTKFIPIVRPDMSKGVTVVCASF